MAEPADDVEAVFLAALDRASPQERAAYVEGACAGRPEMLRRLRELLAAHEGSCGPLDGSPPGLEGTLELPRVAEGPGAAVGPYKLLQQIGEGGMGTVFMAEQTRPVQRKVALKVVKPGLGSHQVLARFEQERQALALMDHPNIARVLDAGTTGAGRPYFVMELVKGVPLTEYCDEHRLTPKERLGLFVDVCRAVQHAHQKGVIHRDLKPSNVLVAPYDGKPVPKVIDFGVAKATGQKLTERTLFTEFGAVVGTLEYMSPEQAELNQLDIDTRSDVYSLGVLLYELLTGTTPLERKRLKTATLLEALRIVREEEPPRPSTRLGTTEELPSIAANRGLEPKKLSGLVRGELDWIVMKALEKDRDRRYETASGLARDVERFLQDQPVQACPPSARYRFRKFVRRNKRALLTLGLVAAALVGGTVASAWQAIRAVRARALAQERLAAAESNLLLARQAVDEMYTEVADDLTGRPHMQPFQRHILEKALRFYQEFSRRQSGDPAIRRETASALLRVGQIQWSLGRRRPAKEACEGATAALEALAAELPAEPQRRSWLGSAYHLRGATLSSAGRLRQAEKNFRQALALSGELAAEDPDNPQYRSQLAAMHQSLVGVLSDRPREAEKALREALKLCKELAAGQRDQARYRPQLGWAHLSLGRFLAGVGRSQEAEGAFRQAINLVDQSGGSPDRAEVGPQAECELGKVLASGGRRGAAEEAYRQAVAGAERLVAHFPDVPGYRQSLAAYSGTLAAFLAQAGRRDEAALFLHRARDLFEKLEVEFADDSDSLESVRDAAVMVLRDAGDLEGAERFLRKALTLARKLAEEGPAEPADRHRVAARHADLGVVLQRRGHVREAADQFRQALVIDERLAAEFPDEPSHRYHQVKWLNFLGIALRELPGEAATALHCHRQALGLCDQLVAEFPEQPQYGIELVRSHFALGIVLRLTGRPAEAVQAFQQALGAHRPYGGTSDSPGGRDQLASVHNELAWLLATCPDVKSRDPGRAVASARKAVELGPEKGAFWNTLGVAAYRAGDWAEARTALAKSMALGRGGDAFDWFFLAMAHWQRGEREEARKWYQQAVAWAEKHRPRDEELRRFRGEAAELLGMKAK
jgi:eukaryotic-like serine/threonine-protein kinase